MARRLNEDDIERLLTEYRSEKRKLIFQLDKVRGAIKELKDYKLQKEEAANSVNSGSSKKTSKRKRGRRKKRTVVGGYKLNDWDQMVIDLIKSENRLLTKAEILEHTKTWAKRNYPRMKVADVEVKLTRVLQKLSGKRGELKGHRTGLMRGYHYGINEWFFESTGKLMKIHYAKLKIEDIKK
jgi:hypothetical protein